MKIANRDARRYVQSRREFTGNNIVAVHRRRDDLYAVFSYGTHWPLFIYVGGLWYENSDKCSPATSKHHTQCHPLCDTVRLDVAHMVTLALYGGYDELVRRRMGVAA